MKTFIAIALLISSSVTFGQTAKKNTKQTAPATRQEVRLTIPKEAVPGEDGYYRYTDKQGKKWLYRNTPFGVSKAEDKGPVVAQVAGPDPTKATVVGDTVKFERANAFGVSKWEKKVADLSDDEKKIVANQKAKQE